MAGSVTLKPQGLAVLCGFERTVIAEPTNVKATIKTTLIELYGLFGEVERKFCFHKSFIPLLQDIVSDIYGAGVVKEEDVIHILGGEKGISIVEDDYFTTTLTQLLMTVEDVFADADA